MKINLKVLDASIIFDEREVENLTTKELVPKMMLRRRLTRSAKLVIELMSKVNFEKGRILFGTGYGELFATSNILNAIINGMGASPTDFQNSVYNTAVSYSSILSNNNSEILTISSGDTTSLKVLKAGAIKALDGDELLLVCSETLNIDNIQEVNKCIKYLESAVILKVKVTTENSNISIDNTLKYFKFPKSLHHMIYIAKRFIKYKSCIFEVNI